MKERKKKKRLPMGPNDTSFGPVVNNNHKRNKEKLTMGPNDASFRPVVDKNAPC
jgi:hypothetical protein